MFDSIEMGISKIVLFDGTPPSVDYVLGLKRQAEVFTMVGCVYGSKRDTLMTLVKRLDEFLLDNNTARLPLQSKLLPIQGKYEYHPSDRLPIYLNELASFLDDNPKLATATGLNGRLLPITICISAAEMSLSDYKKDEAKLQRDLKIVFKDCVLRRQQEFTLSNFGDNIKNYPLTIKDNAVHVKIPQLDRNIDLIMYFKDSKLNEYPLLDVLSRKSVDNIAQERAAGYELPKR